MYDLYICHIRIRSKVFSAGKNDGKDGTPVLYASRGSTWPTPRTVSNYLLCNEVGEGMSQGAHLCGHPSWHLLGEHCADVHSGFVKLARELFVAW